jgi:hypothetical protein
MVLPQRLWNRDLRESTRELQVRNGLQVVVAALLGKRKPFAIHDANDGSKQQREVHMEIGRRARCGRV